jgi:predicted nucleotidyltransferase/biotin operon repressor
MRTLPPPLLPILRSQVAGDLLALLYLHPDMEYSLTDVAETLHSSVQAVHHEVSRLVDAGFIQDRRYGKMRLIRRGPETLLTRPLTDLLAVTYGPLPVMRELLGTAPGVQSAYIYGSWAARYNNESGPIPADIDVLVIGTPTLDDLDDVMEQAQAQLHRPVQIRRVRPETWNDPSPADPFMQSVKSRPLVQIVGDPTDDEDQP